MGHKGCRCDERSGSDGLEGSALGFSNESALSDSEFPGI